MKYRAEIDGLRAVAVIPVILFHAGFTTFGGGYVGVDVFFVISGYLITTIILSEMERDTFSVIRFYERRARRILPALFLIMFVSLPFAWLWLMPSDLKDFAKSLVAVSSFSSNVLFWRESGYWDVASELKPLLHTWSLAVEEQYYVIFPLFLILMWRYGRRWILGSFVLIACASLAAAHWLVFQHPAATFYLLPTRGWELAIGASIAFYFLYRKQTVRTLIANKYIDELLGISGLMMIGYGVFAFDLNTPFPSFYALVPTIGTGLIILFSSSHTVVGRILGAKPLVAIGLISYSAYLWHQPLLAFARHRALSDPSQLTNAVLAFLSFPLAYISWRFVEMPFRDKTRITRKSIFAFSLAGSLAFTVIGVALYLNDGFKQRSIYQDLRVFNYEPDNRILQQQSWKALRELSGDGDYGLEKNSFDRQIWFKKEDNRRKNLLVVGNSFSKDLYNVLINSEVAISHFQIARYGTQFQSLNDSSAEMFSSPNYVQADVVMLVSRYSKADLDSLERVVETLLRDNKRVVLVKNIFEFYFVNNKTLADKLLQKNLAREVKSGDKSPAAVVDEIDRSYYSEFLTRPKTPLLKRSDSVLEAIAKKHSDIVLLDRIDYVCDKRSARCFSIDEGFDKYFYDYGHHTYEGARFFGKRIDQIGWLNALVK